MNRSRTIAISVIGTLAVAGALTPEMSRPLGAQQTGGLPALERRVALLEQQVAALVKSNQGQSAEIVALKQRVDRAEAKLAYVTVEGTEMYITGANLHVRNGLGATNGNPAAPLSTFPNETDVNGLGNLIIGYNQGTPDIPIETTGSHNLVLGELNSYASFAGILAGLGNSTSAPYASALGGRSNRAEAHFSSIVGGAFNATQGHTDVVVGGSANRTGDIDAVVCGGNQNAANARFSVVGGGSNLIQAVEYGWRAGSFGNLIQGVFASP